MKTRIPYTVYRDKVLACWIGKSIGGMVGQPYENHKVFGDAPTEKLWPSFLAPNDDLDIQLVWLEAMQERGLFLASRDLAEFWQDRCWYNFCEYGHFLYNIQRGIAPPLSGTWNNQFFSESEGCPIRAEIWGLVSPGNPGLAAELARKDGELDHGGFSVQVEQFLAATVAQAFVSQSLEEALAGGLSVVPGDSQFARLVPEVRSICEKFPEHPRAWRQVIRAYGDRDASKAVTNHAIVLMSLYLGKLDFKRTIQLCVNSGWDTDCTAATAGALLGVLGGRNGLPADWVENMGRQLNCELKVKHQQASIEDVAEDTARLGVEMTAHRNGAAILTNAPAVTVRQPPPPAINLEVEYPGEPVLWNARPTSVRLMVENPFSHPSHGMIEITAPAGVQCEFPTGSVTVGPGSRAFIEVTIRRTTPGAWLADKNLFTARWRESGQVQADLMFGLGGARQWQVYGPYWDAWDKTRHTERPWPKISQYGDWYFPGEDSYNQYVRLDPPYLDESRLVREDLPEEDPMVLERGEDLITEAHLGGFKGQACYYLVRTFRGPAGGAINANLAVGQSGPYRVWLNGQETAVSTHLTNWTAGVGGPGVQLTDQPQRLVVKVARLTDAFAFSAAFLGAGDNTRQRGVSYIQDGLEDLPAGGV